MRRLIATLTLRKFGENLFSMKTTFKTKSSEEPCIIDFRCLKVASKTESIKQPRRSNSFKMPTIRECQAIRTSLGRKSCLDLIEREKNRPLDRNETREKLLKSAFSYDQDSKASIVRNLYGTELQYRCPFGQKFLLEGMKEDDVLSKEELNRLKATHEITCLWNQTWDKLYDNHTMLPSCVRKHYFLSFINFNQSFITCIIIL